MSHVPTALTPDLIRYIESRMSGRDALLQELSEETERLGPVRRMQISPLQGTFMTLLCQMLGVRQAIEIGSFTGYSGLCLARGLAAGGHLLCCDISDEYTQIARRYWARAGLADRIELRLGPALATLRALPADARFDLAFIDADKSNYLNYYQELVPRLRPGGVILIDNVLWHGTVTDPAVDDEDTRGIRAINDAVAADPRVQSVILPIGDGLTLCRKLSPLMPLHELFLDAWAALAANRVRSLLTTLGVMVGVLAVILLVSVGEGARDYIADSFIGLGANIVQVFPGHRETRGLGPAAPMTTTRKLTLEDAQRLRQRTLSADGVTALLVSSVEARHQNRRRDLSMVGTEESFPQVRQISVAAGRFFRPEEVSGRRRVTVLGSRAAAELFGSENPLREELRLSGTSFQIIGVMASRGVTLGLDLDDQVYIPIGAALDLLAVDGIGSILIRARGRAGVPVVIAEITQLLRRMHDGQEDFSVISQDDMLSTLDGVLRTLVLVLLGIAAVSLLVSGIGIANIMLVTVTEREREIGLRRAVGAKRRHILGQFLTESALIAVVGGSLGVAVAFLIVTVARLLIAELPVHVSGWTVALSLGLAALTGIAAGLVPALRAARLDPAEALRAA